MTTYLQQHTPPAFDVPQHHSNCFHSSTVTAVCACLYTAKPKYHDFRICVLQAVAQAVRGMHPGAAATHLHPQRGAAASMSYMQAGMSHNSSTMPHNGNTAILTAVAAAAC